MTSRTPADRASQLGPRIAVSSFSLRADLGEIRVETETQDGETIEIVLPATGTMTLVDFIGRVRSELGVGAVELCQFQVRDTSPTALNDLTDRMEAADVRITTMPIDIGNIATPDGAQREQYLFDICRWIDIAARLGATFARVNAGAPAGARNSSFTALIDSLQRLANYAAGRDIGLLIENHGGLSSDPEWLLSLFGAVGQDQIGLILDTGNFEPMLSLAQARFAGIQQSEVGVDFAPVYDGITKLAPLATIVHAKAFDVQDDGTTRPVDLRRSLEIIKRAGFVGPITIEYEGDQDQPWDKTARLVDVTRRIFEQTA